MNKKLGGGQAARKLLRRIYGAFYGSEQDWQGISKSLGKENTRMFKLLSGAVPWGRGYEVPFYRITLSLLALEGVLDLFVDCLNSDVPADHLVTLLDDPPLPDDIDDEALTKILWLMFIQLGNQNGISMYSIPISEMVNRVRAGSDEWLFKAVLVDRAVLEAEPVARRICLAEATDDGGFKHELAKAITRTRPRPPEKNLDHARLMLEVLDETVGLQNMTHEAVYDLIVADLELYPDDGKDPMSGLKKLIQKRNKTVGN